MSVSCYVRNIIQYPLGAGSALFGTTDFVGWPDDGREHMDLCCACGIKAVYVTQFGAYTGWCSACAYSSIHGNFSSGGDYYGKIRRKKIILTNPTSTKISLGGVCPDCKGTGVIALFTSEVRCGCQQVGD